MLLSISALLWLVLILVMIAKPEDTGSLSLAGVIVTALPVGIGIYGVRRGRKAPVAKIQRADGATYATQHIVKPAHEVTWRPEPVYPTEPIVSPAQGTLMGVFRRLKEKLRDTTKDRLCAGLGAMGLNARMLERGQA